MEFPHLNDTRYPNLDNVDVYAHQVVFDYTRWVPNTKVYLCNVPWNGDYNDCVKFADDAARDAYFDGLVSGTQEENPDCAIVLEFATNVVQDQVKVPVPYDRATQFNYLVVDVPVATSDDELLPYETKDGNRRWHFFIEGFDATARSTTALDLRLDYWTQYINSVGFNYFLLERGHAPVSASDTDKYLDNPMDNSEYLLTPDVDFGGETISRGHSFIPFGNGEKMLCLASTCPPDQLSKLGSTYSDTKSTFSDPSFYSASNYPNSANRWGYQYEVSGYGFGSGKNYSNVQTRAGNVVSQEGRIPGNVSVYAVNLSEASDFLTYMHDTKPSFLKTIVACFMVAKDLLTLRTSYSYDGHTMYACVGNEKTIGAVNIDKKMFNIPQRYQRFAKLYTYPYSELEVTDNAGKTVRVRIEETGSISAHAITSVAFPYLNMRLFLTGIGGVGSDTYQWTDLRGTSNKSISGSDWYRFCYDMEIPTYALYMDGQTSWELNNYNRSLSNARNSALVNYHNSVRQANNVYNNAIDGNATANTNTKNAATTVRNNTVNLSNTQHTNTNNDADTFSTNNANSRACASDNTATSNACATANTEEANSFDAKDVANAYTRGGFERDTAYTQSSLVTKIENESTTAIAKTQSSSGISVGSVNAASSAVSGITTGIASGAMAGAAAGSAAPVIGTAIGAGVGAVVGGIASAAATYTSSKITGGSITDVAGAVCQANSETVSAVHSGNSESVENQHTVNTYSHDDKELYNNNTNANAVNAATATTDRNNSCNAANTANTVNTMYTNASNLDNVNTANANDAMNTSHGNADRTKGTADNNAYFTRYAEVIAAQDILRNTQNNSKATFNDSRNAATVALCASSGNPAPDYNETRGIQIKVRTQSRNAIKCAGDEFVRYGYMLNQIWEVEDLNLMNHFTYWKARDCWVFDKCRTNDTAQGIISDIFTKGVTVWSDPDEIGKVNPYGN